MTLGGTAVFATVVIALHFLQPGYSPATQLISELAIGRHGWAMPIAFCGLAMATLGMAASVGDLRASLPLRLLLLAVTVCFLLAGAFPLDRGAGIHVTVIALAFVLVVLAMCLFPSLATSSAGQSKPILPRWFCWGAAGAVTLFVALGHSLLPMGIAQRLAAVSLLLWLAGAGWRLRGGDSIAAGKRVSSTTAEGAIDKGFH